MTRPSPPPSTAEPDTPPAPVATEQGMFGEPHPPLDVAEEPEGDGARRVLLWVSGTLLAGAAALWLATLSVAQATDEQVALPALQRGVAALTEIDALLDVQLEEMQRQADAGAETLAPPGFPVRDAAVQTDAVTRADGAVDRALLYDALLRSSARLVYTRGVAAVQGGDEPGEETALLSPSGGVRAVLDGLSVENHETAVLWLWPLGGACLLLGALLLVAASGFGRFVAVGVALVAAAVPVLLGGLAARLALSFVDAGPDDRLVEEFLAIARGLTTLPVRNALWLAAAGVAVALPGALLAALFDRSVRRPPSERPA